MSANLADNAIEILQKARDGEDLDPQHLKLVELAVNGFLNENGRYLFTELLHNVRSGYVRHGSPKRVSDSDRRQHKHPSTPTKSKR